MLLNVSSISRRLSSFDTLRCNSFDAIVTERSTASCRICCRARAVSSPIWFSAFLTRMSASARAFCISSSRNLLASVRVAAMIASASVRACARMRCDSTLRRSSSVLACLASSSDFRIAS